MSDEWTPEHGAGYIPTEEGGNGDSDRTDDDQDEDFEQQWDDLDAKVILAQILAELQQIRLLLSEAETDAQRDSSDEVAYRCRKCGEVLPGPKRERHATSQHNAPPGDELALFEEMDG